MHDILQNVEVDFRYPVAFTTGIFHLQNRLVRDLIASDATEGTGKIICVIDNGVHEAHASLLEDVVAYCRYHEDVLDLVAPPLVMIGGEASKNSDKVVEAVYEAVHRYGIDRHAYVFVIGGGALLDAVGYAAATAHRGVRLVRFPTTVLAQGDSGVGVKNSINRFGKKNFLGTFAPPYAVLNDFHFLTTLSDRDWLGGVSEAIKIAVLKDPPLFDYIEAEAEALTARDLDIMQEVVYRSAVHHLEHIATSGDPFEVGSSRPLDFGHWAAHKLEQLSGYEVRHGEAVAIGIALDSTYAHLKGMLSESEWHRILKVFNALKLETFHPRLIEQHYHAENPNSILAGLNEFREHLGGRLTIMLLNGIGRPIEVHEMDQNLVIDSIKVLSEIASTPNTSTTSWIDITTPVPSLKNN
jgi:3-dehydroquinate synthase